MLSSGEARFLICGRWVLAEIPADEKGLFRRGSELEGAAERARRVGLVLRKLRAGSIGLEESNGGISTSIELVIGGLDLGGRPRGSEDKSIGSPPLAVQHSYRAR